MIRWLLNVYREWRAWCGLPVAKDALTIAEELRAESLRLGAIANLYQTLAQLCEGTHFDVPDGHRASNEELLARMTPEQRAEYDRRMQAWEQRRARGLTG